MNIMRKLTQHYSSRSTTRIARRFTEKEVTVLPYAKDVPGSFQNGVRDLFARWAKKNQSAYHESRSILVSIWISMDRLDSLLPW